MSKIYPYAGFWKRTVAFMIDSVVLTIPTVLGLALLMYNHAASLAPLLRPPLGFTQGFLYSKLLFFFSICFTTPVWKVVLGKPLWVKNAWESK